jgi:AcrR family transcriptional regulator
VFTEKLSSDSAASGRRRGRPPGLTAQGAETRRRLYETALRLIAERGWEATTLRAIGAEAGVSAPLLYRYFPSKGAVGHALYDELSAAFAERARLPSGGWAARFVAALRSSLDVLGPHRRTLAGFLPVLFSGGDDGLFGAQTAFSRVRVQAAFADAVAGARDAPGGETGAALGRLLYLLHLAVLLWWLLDRSPEQRATRGLVALLGRALPLAGVALRLPPVRSMVAAADRLAREALFDDAAEGDAATTPSAREERP